MPIYEYQCRACGHRFEGLVLAGKTPACPKCQSEDLDRLLSMFAVNTAERSQAAIKAARTRYQRSQRDKQTHEAEEIREHIRERQEESE